MPDGSDAVASVRRDHGTTPGTPAGHPGQRRPERDLQLLMSSWTSSAAVSGASRQDGLAGQVSSADVAMLPACAASACTRSYLVSPALPCHRCAPRPTASGLQAPCSTCAAACLTASVAGCHASSRRALCGRSSRADAADPLRLGRRHATASTLRPRRHSRFALTCSPAMRGVRAQDPI